MPELAILIPVLSRPNNIQPLVESIRLNTSVDYNLVFLASPGDEEEITELEKQNQKYLVMDRKYENKGDYARKINHGFNTIKSDWYFLGADDLRFHTNWFEEAMKVHIARGACVIGTNDMGSPIVMRGQHSTHSLVLREYVEECGTIDEPGKVLHEGYQHNFVDTEFVETAKWRGAWRFAPFSRVEHLHPDWKKGVRDRVYDIGKSGWSADQAYFSKRKKLWP